MTESQILAVLPSLATLNAWVRGEWKAMLDMYEAKSAVYFIKNRVIKAAVDLGMSVPVIVAVERPCKTCDPKYPGQFKRWFHGDEYYEYEDCRRCGATGKVTLRFAETRIGDYRFHTPRPRAEFLGLPAERWDAPLETDWTPEQSGAALERIAVIRLLNEMERHFLNGKLVRWGDWIYRNPLAYSLYFGEIEDCWICGKPAKTQWIFGHDIYRPGMRWKQRICDGCQGEALRRPREWPASLMHPRHARGRWIDEHVWGEGWGHRVPLPAIARDPAVYEWLARRGIFEGLPIPGEYAFYPPWGNALVDLVTIKDGEAYVVPVDWWLDIYQGLRREKPMLRVPAQDLRGYCIGLLEAPRP